MLSLVDRVCEHGYVYCPIAGCHDNIMYEPWQAAVELYQQITEYVANEDLPYFYQGADPWSGEDGPDEAVSQALMMLTIEGWDREDKGEGWCST